MDLLATLKKLQRTQPDAHYRARSRHLILQTTPPLSRLQMVGRFLLGNVESAASLALAGLCLFLLLAGFSLWKSFSPLGIAQLDLASLRAEAQAIDIQVKLAELQYEGPSAPTTQERASPQPAPKKSASRASGTAPVPGAPAATPTPPAVPEEAAASSTPDTLSLDEALRELSQ